MSEPMTFYSVAWDAPGGVTKFDAPIGFRSDYMTGYADKVAVEKLMATYREMYPSHTFRLVEFVEQRQ